MLFLGRRPAGGGAGGSAGAATGGAAAAAGAGGTVSTGSTRAGSEFASPLAQVDFAQFVLLHQLDQAANLAKVKNVLVGRGVGHAKTSKHQVF